MTQKVDTNSPEHKRQLAKILAVVFVVTTAGGMLLAQRITRAEAAYEQAHGKQVENPATKK